MPVKRRVPKRRREDTTPPWAQRLLAGELPEGDTEDSHAFFGWVFCGDKVPGLPDPCSAEGYALWMDGPRFRWDDDDAR